MWRSILVSGVVLVAALAPVVVIQGFAVGIKNTKCNLDPSKGEINDPCMSLYGGVCQGKYCACPPGSHEDKNLVRCVAGAPSESSSSGGDLFDLPLDYEPNKPAPAPAPAPAPQPQPPRPHTPNQPQPAYNPNQPRPGYNPNQPQPGYPGYNPNQPQPGYPGYNPNQPQPGYPGYNPNQINNPNQPGSNQPGRHGPTKGGAGKDVKEEVGGGVGGVLGLLLIGGLIYFCCCRGGKHKEVMHRFQGLPFMRGRGAQAPGGAMQMQQSPHTQQDPSFGSQHTYIPPGDQAPPGQYPPPQQPYPAGGVYPAAPYAPQPGYAPYPPPGMFETIILLLCLPVLEVLYKNNICI
ncbi:uncharacterized protein [Panulirus ornatus]|uniref:uncharacterized protein n=1 Tax=Panulirus ornatus TaxID=150431 RepID=UPI003A8B8968